ncbi:MAG: response regulator [Deltaproteobacteria bacterium]|nr:response regulator [Deltaproteobacteria bacterium]
MKKTILLVDDEKDIREVLSISLADIGYEVYTAENGEKALRVFQKFKPAIVLIDIKIPGMDGIELLRKIKHINPDTEVIMITGHGEMDLAIKSLKHEATDFLTKPINDDTLQIALERAYARISMRKELMDSNKSWAMYDVLINELIQEDVMVIGLGHQILDINDTLLKKMGLKREEAVGRLCYEIIYNQDAPCFGENYYCPIKDIHETKQPAQVTHIRRDKDHKDRYYSVSFYPLFIEGEVVGAFELSKDITEDIKFQKVMMQQDKLASIGSLSAGVAHEINNPLTTILTSAMLIQEDIDPDNLIYQELETIANETLRCRKIVASLLDFARQTKPALKLYNINDIIIESIALTRKQAAFDDVTITHDLAEGITDVHVDKDQIQQAMINLIQNAVEATDSGGIVSVFTKPVDQTSLPWYYKKHFPPDEAVEITIKDTGAGITADIMDNIFDPFFTTKESGTGLGLAITHGIIERHAGYIGVQSEQGQGTTFTIRLPVDKGDQDGP